MSTKYDATSSLLADDVGISDHARHRYRQRTPHDCDVSIHEAWRRGEDLKHPRVAQCDGADQPPRRARIYQHNHDWDVIFVIVNDLSSIDRAPTVVSTVLVSDRFEHGPTRAYLHSHGPHNPDPEVGDDE